MMFRTGVDLVDINRVARMIAISPTAYVQRVWTGRNNVPASAVRIALPPAGPRKRLS